MNARGVVAGVLAVWCGLAGVSAQTTVEAPQILTTPITGRLIWTQEAPELVTHHEIRINGVRVLEVPIAQSTTTIDGQPAHAVPLPDLAPGDARVTVAACFLTVCVESDPVFLRIVLGQAVPGGVSWRGGAATWIHDGKNTSQYRVVVDEQVIKAVGVAIGQAQQSTTVEVDVSRPHVLIIEACTAATATVPASCVRSEPVRIPARPARVRFAI